MVNKYKNFCLKTKKLTKTVQYLPNFGKFGHTVGHLSFPVSSTEFSRNRNISSSSSRRFWASEIKKRKWNEMKNHSLSI